MSEGNEERERKFREMYTHLQNSPLYRRKLSAFPRQGVEWSQISTLPLTTKQDLREAGIFGTLAVDWTEIAQYHESTGTTGEPSASWFTKEDLQTGGRQLKECGVKLTSSDLVLIRFPYAMALPAFLMQDAAWQTGAGVVPASGRTVVMPYPRVLSLIKKLSVTVLAGLPREMELLAETARLEGMDLSKDFQQLRAICVAGELMTDKRRKHIEKLWGVPVFNMYGSTETANIATMCEYGHMHIVEEDFYVEVLDEDGLGPVATGEKGYAAITTLSHKASPLLRYFNEDIISVKPSVCKCGRSGSILTHYGRAKDRIAFGGRVIDAKEIQEAVYSLSEVPDAWQVLEQEERLHFLLDSHNAGNWSENIVTYQLSSKLPVPVSVEFTSLLDRKELVSNIPSVKPVYIKKRKT
ncbi:phenylacetate--CoA ligase family protein [Gracilibacillus oryzae]|uniref:Phenylacetate--CoA ligase family protein n=1 Tax=Gracilibacillus oryzae TaxID=1672701 RepID=A0A7C8L3S0_9BACI|nr:AMP-binding protein [Gracilibacillus oryzae]KAB8136766.1 phenylacetate--CoA ligase family protein [Gracilibacillus oryzae]